MKRKPYRLLFYIFARIVAFLLYPFPLNAARRIGSLCGIIAYYTIQKERRRTIAHLKMAFGDEKSDAEIRRITKRVFSNLGKNAVEWISAPKIIRSDWLDRNVTAVGLEHIEEAKKAGKGMIVLGSHFGNWELLSFYLNHIGCRGTMIVRKIYIEQFNRFFEKMRTLGGNEVLYRGESPKKILKVLKDNGVIAIHADQDVESVDGVFVDFFGRPAYTPVAPVKLAARTGAALLPMFVIREGNRFRFVVEKRIEMASSQNPQRDVIVNTMRWTQLLEQYIRRYPDQWVWMHRRWKTKPLKNPPLTPV